MLKNCPAHTANKLIASYIKEIEAQIKFVQKDFDDMNFKNAVARDKMENIVKQIKSDCRSIISELQSYRFL